MTTLRTLGLLASLPGATPSPPPSPTPSPSESAAAGDAALSAWSAALPLSVLLATLLVIGAGLYFAWRYHQKLLDVIDAELKRPGSPRTTTANASAFSQGGGAPGSELLGGEALATPSIQYPESMVVGREGTFVVLTTPEDADKNRVVWTASGGAVPDTGKGSRFACSVDKAGTVTVTATAQDESDTPVGEPWSRTYTVQQAPAPAGGGGIVLPFVIGNWGRFVVTVFGLGLIVVLMLTGRVSEAAGIGVLGTLLGVGAASVERSAPTKAKEENPPEQ